MTSVPECTGKPGLVIYRLYGTNLAAGISPIELTHEGVGSDGEEQRKSNQFINGNH